MKRMEPSASSARFAIARGQGLLPASTQLRASRLAPPSARSLPLSSHSWPASIRGISSTSTTTSSLPSSSFSVTLLCGVRRGSAAACLGSRRFLITSSTPVRSRPNVIDAEPVRPNNPRGQSSIPRSELPQHQIDEQFDRVYEKLFDKKRPGGHRDQPDAPNPFTQDWRERLFDILFSNAGSLAMMTIVVSLFFQISRTEGEHKEYKRLTTVRLDDAQHALRAHQAQVHRAAEARRQELANALAELERTSGSGAALPAAEVQRLVDQLLAGLVADIDSSLAAPANGASGEATDASAPPAAGAAEGALPPAVADSAAGKEGSYHKVV